MSLQGSVKYLFIKPMPGSEVIVTTVAHKQSLQKKQQEMFQADPEDQYPQWSRHILKDQYQPFKSQSKSHPFFKEVYFFIHLNLLVLKCCSLSQSDSTVQRFAAQGTENKFVSACGKTFGYTGEWLWDSDFG